MWYVITRFFLDQLESKYIERWDNCVNHTQRMEFAEQALIRCVLTTWPLTTFARSKDEDDLRRGRFSKRYGKNHNPRKFIVRNNGVFAIAFCTLEYMTIYEGKTMNGGKYTDTRYRKAMSKKFGNGKSPIVVGFTIK